MKRSKLEDIATCLIYDELLTDENWGPIQKLGINHLYESEETALGKAVSANREENVIFLVEHGADINLHRGSVPPIMDAFYVGLPRIFVYLLLKGALVDKKDTEPALIDEFEAMGSVEFLNSLFRESNKTLPGACDYDSLINNQKIMQQKIDDIRSF